MENNIIINNVLSDNYEESESESLTIDNNNYEDYSDEFQKEESQNSKKITEEGGSKQI